jgi:hypothetical protein
MAFWRRSKGRHALGAAVTALPRGPRPPASLPAAPTFAVPAPALAAPAPALAVPAPEPAPSGPRVELTFRDGSSASLDPTQARALEEIAQVLTRRDEVKH